MDKSVVEDSKIRCKVKKERFDDEIKEFAETTMNEMLGWYGYDTNRREMQNTTQYSHHTHSNSTSSDSDSPKYTTEGCGWCGKQVEENTGLTSSSSTFCSELCFSQSRRANFKKNKTCDWCRHVRHTVSYVDFQEGASQLQFCSDKCLNQYKMQIFCRETRAHLEMHPHLTNSVDESENALITPDLWMKNCKSPDSKSSTPPQSPLSLIDVVQQTSPLPLITLTHPSKLLATTTENEENVRTKRSKLQKKRKRSSTITTTHNNNNVKIIDGPQDLRIRHSPINICESDDTRTRFERKFLRSDSFCENANINQTQSNQNHGNILPPVTVLVPYPILLPVPLPIPIPLPITSFLRAEKTRNGETSSLNDKNTSHKDNVENDNEEKIVNKQEITNNTVISTPIRKRKRVVDSKSKIQKNTAFLTTTTL